MSRHSSIAEQYRTVDAGREWPEDFREEIEREANSDATDAWVFQRILDNLDGGRR